MELVATAGDLLAQILDSSFPLWGEGLTRQAYESYNVAQQATRWGRQHLARVALVDGPTLLSSAKRYRLQLSIDGRVHQALGIAAVFTAPALVRQNAGVDRVCHLQEATPRRPRPRWHQQRALLRR